MPSKDSKKNPKSKEPVKPPLDYKRLILPAIMLAVLIFLTFSFSLHNKFTNWDDGYYVTNNKDIQGLTPQHVKDMFTNLVTDVYVPLTLITFAIEYHFVKLNSFLYILDNILLHIGVVIMIFIFGCRIGLPQRAAFLGALLFGIHPMHVESVVWITERKDVLYSFFYMLAVLQYWTYLENNFPAQWDPKLGIHVT